MPCSRRAVPLARLQPRPDVRRAGRSHAAGPEPTRGGADARGTSRLGVRLCLWPDAGGGSRRRRRNDRDVHRRRRSTAAWAPWAAVTAASTAASAAAATHFWAGSDRQPQPHPQGQRQRQRLRLNLHLHSRTCGGRSRPGRPRDRPYAWIGLASAAPAPSAAPQQQAPQQQATAARKRCRCRCDPPPSTHTPPQHSTLLFTRARAARPAGGRFLLVVLHRPDGRGNVLPHDAAAADATALARGPLSRASEGGEEGALAGTDGWRRGRGAWIGVGASRDGRTGEGGVHG
eukprot:352139-Chlamydomonas_euryale.AAC.2